MSRIISHLENENTFKVLFFNISSKGIPRVEKEKRPLKNNNFKKCNNVFITTL
jgi:hypothetical protein